MFVFLENFHVREVLSISGVMHMSRSESSAKNASHQEDAHTTLRDDTVTHRISPQFLSFKKPDPLSQGLATVAKIMKKYEYFTKSKIINCGTFYCHIQHVDIYKQTHTHMFSFVWQNKIG